MATRALSRQSPKLKLDRKGKFLSSDILLSLILWGLRKITYP
jgi:hypothetical protein